MMTHDEVLEHVSDALSKSYIDGGNTRAYLRVVMDGMMNEGMIDGYEVVLSEYRYLPVIRYIGGKHNVLMAAIHFEYDVETGMLRVEGFKRKKKQPVVMLPPELFEL